MASRSIRGVGNYVKSDKIHMAAASIFSSQLQHTYIVNAIFPHWMLQPFCCSQCLGILTFSLAKLKLYMNQVDSRLFTDVNHLDASISYTLKTLLLCFVVWPKVTMVTLTNRLVVERLFHDDSVVTSRFTRDIFLTFYRSLLSTVLLVLIK